MDILTKPLYRVKFLYFRDKLGMTHVATKFNRPWRGVPYKEITRLRENNGVVAHYHHNQNPLLFIDFHRWEESRYVRRSTNGYSRFMVQGDSMIPSTRKAQFRLDAPIGGNSLSL